MSSSLNLKEEFIKYLNRLTVDEEIDPNILKIIKDKNRNDLDINDIWKILKEKKLEKHIDILPSIFSKINESNDINLNICIILNNDSKTLYSLIIEMFEDIIKKERNKFDNPYILKKIIEYLLKIYNKNNIKIKKTRHFYNIESTLSDINDKILQTNTTLELDMFERHFNSLDIIFDWNIRVRF